jgi:hypothetical protein
MPMTEDLSPFFNKNEHATEVQIDGQTVAGILDRGYADVSGMGTTRPSFTCPLSEVPYVEEGSTLVAPADAAVPEITVYEVRTPEPDGTGMVTLPLTLSA